MYRSRRLMRRMRTSLAVGVGLGLCNTLIISAFSGLLVTRNYTLIFLFAVVSSLLFSLVYFFAKSDWRRLLMHQKPWDEYSADEPPSQP